MPATTTTRPPRLRWADARFVESPSVGDFGYLVEVDRITSREPARLEFTTTTPRTNMSREVRLHGWLGTYNDVARHARGRCRVVRVTCDRDGETRVQVIGVPDRVEA